MSAVPERLGTDVAITVADAVAAAVLTCPAVAGLHGGRHGEVATYLPGRRVTGVRMSEAAVAVHVAGRYPATITEIATQVRAAVGSVVTGPVVAVTVEDVVASGAVAGLVGSSATRELL